MELGPFPNKVTYHQNTQIHVNTSQESTNFARSDCRLLYCSTHCIQNTKFEQERFNADPFSNQFLSKRSHLSRVEKKMIAISQKFNRAVRYSFIRQHIILVFLSDYKWNRTAGWRSSYQCNRDPLEIFITYSV